MESIRVYHALAPRVWVEQGYTHPLGDHLVVSESAEVLIRSPRNLRILPGPLPQPQRGDWLVTGPCHEALDCLVGVRRIAVSLRFSSAPAMPESLWKLTFPDLERVVSQIPQRMHRNFEVACAKVADARWCLLRWRGSFRKSGHPPLLPVGYVSHPRLPGLYLPQKRRLIPDLRPSKLAEVFECQNNRIVWLDEEPDKSIRVSSLPMEAFQPLDLALDWVSCPAVRLDCSPRVSPFALESARWRDDQSEVLAGLEALPPPVKRIRPPATSPSPGPHPIKWLRKVLSYLPSLGHKDRNVRGSPAAKALETTEESEAAGKWPTRDTLLHGTDWPSRKKELEALLVGAWPQLLSAQRAELWANLATTYTAMGHNADAALCWINAIWETTPLPATPPPIMWLKQWLLAESRWARFPLPGDDFPVWLAVHGEREDTPRLLAALVCESGLSGQLDKLHALRPSLNRQLDDPREALPIRLAWMTALQLHQSDALALARWRDRLLEQLDREGLRLDRDVPSALRFHGTAQAERFPQAREWLLRCSDTLAAWFRRFHGGPCRDVGLDAETTATSAILHLMLAWAMECVGERTRAQHLTDSSLKELSADHSTDRVRQLVGRMYQHRIQEVREGSYGSSGWPDVLIRSREFLSDWERYAVDRLRSSSKILEPVHTVHPYRGDDIRHVFGSDALGDRLCRLLGILPDNQLVAEADSLLELCDREPVSGTLPRVVYALMEVSSRLPSSLMVRALSYVRPALEWMETWLSEHRSGEISRGMTVQANLLQRAVCAAALAGRSHEAQALAEYALALGPAFCQRLIPFAGNLFRAWARLGLFDPLEAMLHQMGQPADLLSKTQQAIGWFLLQRDDVGTLALDECRQQLYLVGGDLRERTRLALAYVNALAVAPLAIGMGRLEELFQRLGPTHTIGSTNRFFTLQPLELVDAAIRAVVGELFQRGPTLAFWREQDEFLIRLRIQRDFACLLRQHGLEPS